MRSTPIVAMSLAALLLSPSLASAAVGPAKCIDTKAKTAGKEAEDLLKALGKNLSRNPDTKLDVSLSKARSKLTKGFTKAEAKGGCAKLDDADDVEAAVSSFVVDVVAGVSPPTTSTTTTTTTTTTATTTTVPSSGGCGAEDTFTIIQSEIFTPSCALSTCHGAFPQAGLDLLPSASYPSLIDVPAFNPAAAARGKVRVLPGDAASSFLSQKLRGTHEVDEGGSMPPVGGPLSAVELDLIDAWIDAGAPQVGVVESAPCLPEESYVPADPLTPPAGGYQIVLDGPTLQPGQEQEGCMWIPTPNVTDFNIGRWVFSLNPGTHHFAIFEYNRAGTPTTGVWNANDFGCFSGAQFGNSITGAPQAPSYVDAYPPGVARVLAGDGYLGLNAHYFNEFDVPIQIKVWINIEPFDGTPTNIAETIVAIDDTFGIDIPPFSVQVHPPPGQPRARWPSAGDPLLSSTHTIISLGGHMHHNGVRFTIWAPDGTTKLYESFDWAHPQARFFEPPITLAPGQYFTYECEYDNGVDRPVRLDSLGNPTNLRFGVSALDAMCILTGQFY